MTTTALAQASSSEQGGKRKWGFIVGTVLMNILAVLCFLLLSVFFFLVMVSARSLARLDIPLGLLEIAYDLYIAYPILWLVFLIISIILLVYKRYAQMLYTSIVPNLLALVIGSMILVFLFRD